MSLDQKQYLISIKKKRIIITSIQIIIIITFLSTWELLARYKIINTFLFSSPSRIIETTMELINTHNLFPHIWTTLFETIIAFILGILIGLIISIILYEYPFVSKVLDPFLTMLNSLPKVALGPLIIIIAGANVKSIIVMALLINLIISIITIYNGFLNIDKTKLKLFNSLKANKIQKLKMLIIPGSFPTIISSLKINISMSLIGVIMGEFLVSKKGIGYLIIYGTQIFNLDLVMLGILLLAIISFVLYEIVFYIEKKLIRN